MRGTLHLLPAAELPMWQAALSTRRPWESGAWQRGFGVTLAELERLNDAVAQALDGQLLTREELAARVGELTGSPTLGDKLRESWGVLLKPAAALGLLCFAPSKGQQVRFTSPGTWLGGWAARDPEEAMDEVTRRFLAPGLAVAGAAGRGRMEVVWRQEGKGRRVQVTIEPFAGPRPPGPGAPPRPRPSAWPPPPAASWSCAGRTPSVWAWP
jgi:hypothetical protein